MEAVDTLVHAAYMAAKVVSRLKKEPRYGVTYIRQWRTHRVLSLEQLAERVGLTHASLSRVERGLQPYNQDMLEALASALGTDVVSLLIRDPTDPDGIWTVWDQAKPAQRNQIVEIAKAVLRTA